MPRRLRYALIGALLALGAPVGWLALRAACAQRMPGSVFVAGEFAREPALYLYLLLSTIAVFTLFGFALGRQADRLARLSILDPLTGLLNARAFSDRLTAECARASRYREPLSLLLIDIDGLKQVNDRLGHLAGDAALTAVAAAVRGGSRTSDSTSRWGGDEFAVIAPNTGTDAATRMAERIRELAAEAPADGSHSAVTVSVGIATWQQGDRECAAAQLKRDADAALYEAKRAGRNRVRA